jgi:hypothetical protein
VGAFGGAKASTKSYQEKQPGSNCSVRLRHFALNSHAFAASKRRSSKLINME